MQFIYLQIKKIKEIIYMIKMLVSTVLKISKVIRIDNKKYAAPSIAW